MVKILNFYIFKRIHIKSLVIGGCLILGKKNILFLLVLFKAYVHHCRDDSIAVMKSFFFGIFGITQHLRRLSRGLVWNLSDLGCIHWGHLGVSINGGTPRMVGL